MTNVLRQRAEHQSQEELAALAAQDTREFDILAVKELLKPTLFRPLGDRLLDAGDNPDAP